MLPQECSEPLAVIHPKTLHFSAKMAYDFCRSAQLRRPVALAVIAVSLGSPWDLAGSPLERHSPQVSKYICDIVHISYLNVMSCPPSQALILDTPGVTFLFFAMYKYSMSEAFSSGIEDYHFSTSITDVLFLNLFKVSTRAPSPPPPYPFDGSESSQKTNPFTSAHHIAVSPGPASSAAFSFSRQACFLCIFWSFAMWRVPAILLAVGSSGFGLAKLAVALGASAGKGPHWAELGIAALTVLSSAIEAAAAWYTVYTHEDPDSALAERAEQEDQARAIAKAAKGGAFEGYNPRGPYVSRKG
jgi:hypothetical protein